MGKEELHSANFTHLSRTQWHHPKPEFRNHRNYMQPFEQYPIAQHNPKYHPTKYTYFDTFEDKQSDDVLPAEHFKTAPLWTVAPGLPVPATHYQTNFRELPSWK